MEFTSKTVVCKQPGISQEEALAGLYQAYGDDVRVASIKRRGDAWVASIQQKVAEFPPPKKEEGASEESSPPDTPEDNGPPTFEDEAPADDSGADPMAEDGPPVPGEEGEGGEKGELKQILHLLHEVVEALGLGGGHDKLAPGDDPMAPPPPGPPGGPGPADASPLKKPTKLRPGEVLPTQTPIGSPAFSSTQKVATITVESARVDPRQMTAAQAAQDLNRQFAAQGYKVKQLRYDRTSGTYQALLSIH